MKRGLRVALITIAGAIPAFLTGRLIWPPDPSIIPTAAQLPYFAFLAALEAFSFGLGLAFLFEAYPFIGRFPEPERKLGWAMYASVGWLLVSWWPHDNLHQHIGMDLQKLLYVEYGFHFTLIIAGFIVAKYFWKQLSRR